MEIVSFDSFLKIKFKKLHFGKSSLSVVGLCRFKKKRGVTGSLYLSIIG